MAQAGPRPDPQLESHQDPRFLGKSFDPFEPVLHPGTPGTTGLGYNKKSVAGPRLDSWAAVFDPKNKGKILMLDDVRSASPWR